MAVCVRTPEPCSNIVAPTAALAKRCWLESRYTKGDGRIIISCEYFGTSGLIHRRFCRVEGVYSHHYVGKMLSLDTLRECAFDDNRRVKML